LRLSRLAAKLKGDVVRSFSHRRIRALAEKADLSGHDFGAVALARSVLRFVLAGCKPPFDIDLPALGQEPLARIRQPSESDDPVLAEGRLRGEPPTEFSWACRGFAERRRRGRGEARRILDLIQAHNQLPTLTNKQMLALQLS
jgi:hypothetical protein